MMSADVKCPKCSGPMFDERNSKFWNGGKTKNGKDKPTFKCQDKDNCDGVAWEKGSSSPAKAVESREHNYGPPLPGESAPAAPGANAPAPKAEPPTLCADYLSAVGFVLDRVLPRFEAKGLTMTAEAACAAIATVFIAKTSTRRN